jgi:hypothetical protein
MIRIFKDSTIKGQYRKISIHANKPEIVVYVYESQVISIQFQFQFFVIYVPSQQLQGQLQTQQSVDASNYIMGEHNLKSKANER